jgi:hypothetical protein
MRTGISITLTAADRRRLEATVGDRNAPQKHVDLDLAEVTLAPRFWRRWFRWRARSGFITETGEHLDNNDRALRPRSCRPQAPARRRRPRRGAGAADPAGRRGLFGTLSWRSGLGLRGSVRFSVVAAGQP